MTMLKPAGHAPSVLEVITDLSNDEVFTPPKVANAVLDLLPETVWADPTLRWVDIGAKTGVFLREITRRLMAGLVDALPDETERLDHILRNMVHGIAITELTSLMSRRTLYCSKKADSEHSVVKMQTSAGNVWFERVEHSYENGRCAECSASEELMERENRENHAYAFIHASGHKAVEKEIGMKFDVIVGNPPYQMEVDASGKNVVPLYELFVEQAKSLNPRFISMVIPSRWMLGGRGLDEFRSRMLKDRRIRTIVDYPNSAELFPAVDIKSGVCYFLWDRDNEGLCSVTTRRGGSQSGPAERSLDEYDVFVRDSRAIPLLHRVLKAKEPGLDEIISTRDPFGPTLGSNFRGYRRKQKSGDVRLYMNQESSGTSLWVERSAATRNTDLIDCWKLLIPKAGPGNSGGHVLPDSVLSKSQVASPGSVCSATYLVAGPLKSESEADSMNAYMRTRFVRFLVSLRKASQNTTRDSYTWVPQQTWDHEWTDAELYKKYGITDEEQAYIAEMIREMAP